MSSVVHTPNRRHSLPSRGDDSTGSGHGPRLRLRLRPRLRLRLRLRLRPRRAPPPAYRQSVTARPNVSHPRSDEAFAARKLRSPPPVPHLANAAAVVAASVARELACLFLLIASIEKACLLFIKALLPPPLSPERALLHFYYCTLAY